MKTPQQIDGNYTLRPPSRLKPVLIVLAIFAAMFIAAFIEFSTDPRADKPYQFEKPSFIDRNF